VGSGSGLGIDKRRATGQKALKELREGKIQRIGKGGPRDLYRYFAKRGKK
jgi:hypothetical protein